MQGFDLVFDRQAVAVPARHVRRIEARHRLGAEDDVLEDLVQRVADVDVAVGIGGAVVQDEARAASRSRANFFIELFLLPLLNPAGLTLGQIPPHRERGIGHVQCLSIFSHCSR